MLNPITVANDSSYVQVPFVFEGATAPDARAPDSWTTG